MISFSMSMGISSPGLLNPKSKSFSNYSHSKHHVRHKPPIDRLTESVTSEEAEIKSLEEQLKKLTEEHTSANGEFEQQQQQAPVNFEVLNKHLKLWHKTRRDALGLVDVLIGDQEITPKEFLHSKGLCDDDDELSPQDLALFKKYLAEAQKGAKFGRKPPGNMNKLTSSSSAAASTSSGGAKNVATGGRRRRSLF